VYRWLQNANLFGGPLNSGYQTDTIIEVDESGNATIETPDETMLEQYFHPSLEGFQNVIDRVSPQLFLLLPTLFIAPLGCILDFKKDRVWLLVFWIIPTLFIYTQLTWVGQVPVEDMRYFLPVLPPTAILSAYAIGHNAKDLKNGSAKSLLFISLALLTITGFLMAHYGINWQIHRRELGPIFYPPLMAILFAISLYVLIYSKVLGKIVIEWKEKR